MRSRARWGLVMSAAFVAVACSGNFDTTREPRPFAGQATLGQEIYGVLCDRIGAGAINEDPSGRSYQAVCHPDDEGNYADQVDVSRLPPVTGQSAIMRNLAVAKVEALARHRDDLVRAIDVLLPDTEIDDPFPPDVPRKVHLHNALRELVQRLNPLYDSNPMASMGASSDPLLPSATQSTARLFQALIDSPEAQQALSQMGGRSGYRPLGVTLGAIGPVLAYPNLRSISQNAVRVLQPGGAVRSEFVQLLNAVHQELRTAETELPLAPYEVFGATQPNRPRDNLEILQTVLLSTHADFAQGDLDPGFIVLRDHRGFALASGSVPGMAGSVTAPFADSDGDGLADIDAYGRFVSAAGELVAVDLPFAVPGEARVRDPDTLGRALLDNGLNAYQYIDTTQTFASALTKDLRVLVDPDPANDRRTLMSALAGAYPLFGDRVQLSRIYGPQSCKANQDPGCIQLDYRGFDPDTSPLVDLIHASGQVLAHPQSDDFLQQLIDLLENHEQLMARVIGASLELKRIGDKYPDVALPRESTLWDEMALLLDQITDVKASDSICTDPAQETARRSLLEDLLLSLGDDRSLGLGSAYANLMQHKDRISYDSYDVNGPTRNLTTGDFGAPRTPVDRSQPATGDNRSGFQRSLQIIHDTAGATACNRDGAIAHLKSEVLGLFNMEVEYPSTLVRAMCLGKGTDHLNACDLFEIRDLAVFYLQSMIEDDPNLPAQKNCNKGLLDIKDACLTSLDWATDMDDAFEMSSELKGLTTHPTHTALSRLVFFGADSSGLPAMPDLDPTRNDLNSRMNKFISGLQDPVASPVCTKNSEGMNECHSPDGTLRVRDPGTIFLWEHFGFADANRPLLHAFYKHNREKIFTSMVSVLHRHMSDANHGKECQTTGSGHPGDSNYNHDYCFEDGLVHYEPMLAEQMTSDILPALNALIKVVDAQRIKSTRYLAAEGSSNIERRGTEIMADMTRVLFSSSESATMGLEDRFGEQSARWSDGVRQQDQVTPFYLFADALKKMDDRFENAQGFDSADLQDRKAKWRKARSQLVDQFLAVDGTGTHARFRNPAVPKTLVTVLKVLREQLNANCPNREKGETCTWARDELAQKFGDVLKGPLFAAIIDLIDGIRRDPNSIEVERLLQYLLTTVEDDETLRSVLASAVDLVQVLRDGQTLPPIMRVLSSVSVPDGTKARDGLTTVSGSADIVLQLLAVLSKDPEPGASADDPNVFDRYHVLDQILPNLTKPIHEDRPSKTVLEVIVDVAADVNRYNSADEGPLTTEDYKVIAHSVHEFLTSETRGMEQLYEVVRGRDGN